MQFKRRAKENETPREREKESESCKETVAKASELSLHKVNARIYSKYSLFIRFVIQNVCFVVSFFYFHLVCV